MNPRIISIAILTAGFALAQDSKPQDTKPDDTKKSADQEKEQAYEGPSILSRDKSLIGERGGKLIDFRFYGEVTGIYDSGLTPIQTNAQGNLINVGSSFGEEVGGGIIGTRKWKRDQLSIDYHGAYRHYSTTDQSGGLDQFLDLGYSHVVSRRVILDFKEIAGSSTLANGAYSYLPLTNTDLFAVPTNELFDTRTTYFQSRVDLVWQKSARLSFGLGGEGFIVRRNSFALAGTDGYAARANVAYRLTRRQTISANYGYTDYDFQRFFGNSKLQTAQLGYSYGLSRIWDFGIGLGATRISSLGTNLVTINPAIAAIIGQNSVEVTYFRIVTIPAGDLRITRRFDRSSLSLSASVGASPGDGVYLTSRQTAASADYSYVGFKRFSTGLNLSYGQLSAVGQTLGKYTNLVGGAGITYKIANGTHMQLRYDYRHYTTQDTAYQKDSQRLSIGLAFSPGNTPLAIW